MDDEAEARALLARWGIKRGPTAKELHQDRLGTVFLLVGDFLLMGVLAIMPAWSLGGDVCPTHPGECNEALRAFTIFMGGWAMLIIFVASILVSVVLLIRRRLAFYVPVIGAAAMIGCFVVWMILARNGFLIPYP